MSELLPINQMKPGETYKGYAGGLYGNYENELPEDYRKLGVEVANQLAKDRNIALATIGASSISMESQQLFSKLKQIPGIRKDIRMVNACKGGTTFEKMDERYWNFVRDAIMQNGVRLNDVKIVIVKSDTLTYNGPDSIEYVRTLIDVTVSRMKKSDLFPNLKMVYFTGRNGTHWVPVTEPKHVEPRAYDNGFAVREFIADHINFSQNELASGIFVDWLFYAWTDGVNRREDGWLWTENFTQDEGIHPSPLGREQFAIAIKKAVSNNEIAQIWMKRTAANLEVTPEVAANLGAEEGLQGAKLGDAFNPDEEFGKEDVNALPVGKFVWVSENEADGVRFVEDANGPMTYVQFRERFPFQIEEGVFSAEEAVATKTVEHAVHQADVDANPDADLKVGEKAELLVTDFEEKTIEDAKTSDLPGGETDKHVTDAAESADNVKQDSNADSKDSKTNTKKINKKDAGSKK